MINEHDIKAMCTPEELALKEKAWADAGEVPPWKSSANSIQIGGDHYKQFKGMEPWDVITGWNLGYLDGTALKYIARWQHKGGVQDLEKAIHFLQKAVEVYQTEKQYNPIKR